MRAHYLQHVHFEGLGSIEPWLVSQGYTITCTQLYQSTNFPDPIEIDLLIIMGGPMSVNDEAEHTWLEPEKLFIKQCIERNIPTLGICLGAQLIADVMGANIYLNPEKEIGWFPVTATDRPHHGTFSFPQETLVFHWHGETFNLPDNAVNLAESECCSNQAFQIGDNIIGLQFHLETTPALARALTNQCGDELTPSTYIQEKEMITGATEDQYQEIHQLMETVLVYLRQSQTGHNNPS